MKMFAALFAFVIVAVVGVYFMSYNTLIGLKHGVEEGAAAIDTQLQRRSDLIPNLVATVKGFARHETEVFKSVTDARERMMSASTMAEKSAANGELSGALSRLLAISESYPELKSDKVYIGLMDELSGTENRIAHARDKYNRKVRALNETMEKLPYSMLVPSLAIDKADYFEAEASARKPVKVELD
ncbi:MAG: LemA family protein [Succinivibrionaceae bacterium]|nr:LemA family protein [Succinivibrionaceae bacterium]